MEATRRHALIVEPSATMTNVIAAIAAEVGLDCDRESSIAAGIASVTSHRPVFVIVPHLSTELPGEALARAIRTCPTFAAIPVAMVTSGDPDGYDCAALELDRIIRRGPNLRDDVRAWLAELGLEPEHVDRPTVPGRILLAEDTALMQQLISRKLHAAGATVTIVDDGERAVERARKESFDLILLDIEMPNMTGPEACAILRTMNPGCPIVAVTGHGAAYEEEAIRLGFDGVIDKQQRPRDLVAGCAEWLKRRRAA